MCFLADRHFFLFRLRVFPRALGFGARRSPPEHEGASVAPGRAPRHVLWGFKVASNHGEAFRARRAIQAHANPRTQRKCPTAHVMSTILNVVKCRQTLLVVGDGKVFPRHQLVRHATTFSTISYNILNLGRIVSSHA